MTALELAAIRQLISRVLTHQAPAGADAAAIAAAARCAYEDLAGVLAPLIGQVGVDTLAARAVHLAQRDYPWLAITGQPHLAEAPFIRVNVSLEKQDPALATEAAAAVLAIFTSQLVTFIGRPLTTRLMRQAWPGGFSDASTGTGA